MVRLNTYDYVVIVVYMLLMVGVGAYFFKFVKSGSDYFRAGNKLTWWVAGLSSFMSSFSVWMFTGGAGIVYEDGLTGALALLLPGAAIFTGYLLFARLWRRSRVSTLMEYLEERFNLTAHQVASWFYVPVYLLYSATALFSLGIFVSAALRLDIVTVIVVSGVVILAYTLLGGVWAVSVTDAVQFIVLLPVCLLMVPLALKAVGGFGGLAASAPEHYFDVPTRGLPWHYLIAYLLVSVLGQNTNPIAQRYFSVRNEREAGRVSLMCSGLFLLGVVIWAVPPMAARIIYPELGGMIDLPNPGEGSYVVIAMHLLPHGLAGLLVAAMFATAMSSLDSVYNVIAAIVSKDILQRLFFRSMSEKAVLRTGQVVTLLVGLAVTGLSIMMVEYGQGAFRVMMKLGSLTITPMAAPMLMGFLYRRAGAGSFLLSFACGVATAVAFAFYPPLGEYLQSAGPWVEFSVSTFAIVLVSVTVFVLSPLLFRPARGEYERIGKFFRKLDTPVNESTEIGEAAVDNISISRFIGIITMVLGAIVTLFVFIPGTVADRMLNGGTGIVVLLFGLWLSGREKRNHALGYENGEEQ